MKIAVILIMVGFFISGLEAQNTGIGTTTPTRAKLEVIGVAGSGNTSGIFGVGGAGISLQQNWPAIGFNQYRDDNAPGGPDRYMSTGFAAVQYLNPTTGIMAIDMFPSGTANALTPVGLRAMTFNANGNTGIRTGIANATLAVARGDGIEGTAVFQGSIYSTQFNYNVNEDTYIRPGKESSRVLFSNLTGGDVLIGNGITRLAINRPGVSIFSTVEIQCDDLTNRRRYISLFDSYDNSWTHGLQTYPLSGAPDVSLMLQYLSSASRVIISYVNGNLETKFDLTPINRAELFSPVLSRLSLLNPVSYEMINENPDHIRSIGFIAQEVKKLFPDAVRVISDNNRKEPVTQDLHTMNYSYFGVLAIQALKEQWEQIKALEQEQEALLQEIEGLLEKSSR